MKYTKLQKFLSSFIIFSLLFGITIRVPLLNFATYAGSSDFYNLVSIIIDEDTYDEVESEVKRYASDIQGVLENTRVVILPTSKDATAYDISSLNESLYFEGYKSVKDVLFESKLVGTVLIGNFNLPFAYKDGSSMKTILPFTDFEDKSYIYNHITNKYEYNNDNSGGIKSEIWHGVISPNTGDFDTDINSLENYFDKNHDFYEGRGNFILEDGIIDGNKNNSLPINYEPFVFYFDAFRESKALNYNSYIGYKGYLDNKEDLVYKRYTKELAQKLKNEITGAGQEEIYELAKKVNPDLDVEDLKEKSNLDNVPDVQTRYIANNVVKKFIEIFSKGSIGELRKDVHNAGRYNDGRNVNTDFVPYLVSVLDIVNDEFVKEINDELENEIDKVVENGLSRNIGIGSSFRSTFSPVVIKTSTGGVAEAFIASSNVAIDTYKNTYYGKKAEDITRAIECSIYRGSLTNSGKLVEANRGYNIKNIEKDRLNLEKDYGNNPSYHCWNNIGNGSAYNGRWGGNTPFNLDKEQSAKGIFELVNNKLDKSITPLFDIAGSKETKDSTKIISPLSCNYSNFILVEDNEIIQTGGENGTTSVETVFRSPIGGSPINWSCTTGATQKSVEGDFEKVIAENPVNIPGFSSGDCSGGTCENKVTHSKNGNYYNIKKEYYSCLPSGENNSSCQADGNIDEWNFKIIPSNIKHKSPTTEELKIEIESMVAQSLPVDKDRYIDFIGANGKYQKINYPYLFRVENPIGTKFDFEKSKEILDKYLDEKSEEINNVINNNKPDTNSNVYNILKNGEYPDSNFDLKEYLKSKGNKELIIDGEKKIVSYYEILVFSIYWNNLNSVSSKYGFIFDNYLSDQTENNNKFFLPKNKKQYEIAYLGASGDAQNMYIGLDPEKKGTNPYSDIIGKNQDLSSKLLGANIGTNQSVSDQVFKCAPPEGVPLWEWIPAIMCRLGNMMPPTISIGEGKCGVSLLTNDEKEELKQCNGDVNKNGVNDCLENKLSGATIDLVSDSSRYNYLKNVKLEAKVLDKNDNIINYLNSTNINFEVTKIEELKNNKLEVVFDKDDIYKDDKGIFSTYLEFKEKEVRAQSGIAKYGLSVKSKDVNIYIQSKISLEDKNKEEVITVDSNELKIEVRQDRLFGSSSTIVKTNESFEINSSDSSIKASDELNVYIIDGNRNNINDISKSIFDNSVSDEKLIFQIDNLSKNGNKQDIYYPLEISLLNSNNKLIQKEIFKSENINSFKGLYSIKKAGSYKIEVKDKFGNKLSKDFTIMPEKAVELDLKLGSNIIEANGVITTNFVTVYDKFKNPVIGKLFDYNFTLDNSGLEFVDNESTKFVSSSMEGYKIFRLKSKSKTGIHNLNIELKDENQNSLISVNKDINVLKDIKLFSKSLSGELKVGGDIYKQEVSLRDSTGKILEDFNSRVYLVADSIYLDSSKPYFEIKNGVGEIEFKTKTLAGKNIPIEYQVEGLSEIISKTITINPDEAIKMDLILSKSKMEASSTEKSLLTVELKDRYNNLVFTDSKTRTNLEIKSKYLGIIIPESNSEVVKEGKSEFVIYGTKTPGLAYFKVSTNPSLALNSFIVQSETGEVEIPGVGENAGKIETFYLWNKNKIEGNNYNGIYTTLLGSNYGDIEQVDYLAGSLLFDKNNRSLAVTSLLNNPINTNDVINISKKGGISTVVSSSDLMQDLRYSTVFEKNKLYLNVFNESLNTYIGKIFYNLDDENKLSICNGDINECTGSDETSIGIKVKDSGYKAFYDDDKIIFRDNSGKTYIEVLENGEIIRRNNIEFEVNDKTNNSYLSINLKIGETIIGELFLKLVDSKINISRDKDLFETKKDNYKNSILIFLDSKTYGSYDNGKGNNSSKIIYYVDPFGSKDSLNTFSKSNYFSFENFKTKSGLGWSEGNKTLLSFSSGNSVGESLKEYMSFSSINLGDPVISLKKIKEKIPKTNVDRQFDSTIGKVISSDENVKTYRIFDYDNDGLKDILLVKDDNFLQLLENKNGEFIDKGNLANVVDLGNSDYLKTGDFTGDGFDDIFYVNKEGKPLLLNNVDKNFEFYPLSGIFGLEGRIVRAESFDMDSDNIFDIVTLDDSGELNIFYGLGTSSSPKFTKNTLTKDYGVVLNSDSRSDNAFVYFEGLYQVDKENELDDLKLQNKKYLEKIEESIESNVGPNEEFKEEINTGLLNNLIFEQINYSTSNEVLDLSFENLDLLKEIPETSKQTTFIKSEFSESAGIKVDKVFLDKNGGFIKSGDLVEVEVKLTNLSGKKLNNIAFIDKIEPVFRLNTDSISNTKDLTAKDPNNSYDFLIDKFSLNNNEVLTINYILEVKPIKYGFLEVGLFEKGEVGDDIYGDVIIKTDNQNCSNPVDIFRSTSKRGYNKDLRAAVCDENSVKLPDSLEKNSIDKNENGVPDYIDELTGNIDKAKEYAQEELKNIFKDKDDDGIPDEEDNFNNKQAILSNLTNLDENIDSGLDDIQNFVNSLSCGFAGGGCIATPLNWAPLAPGGDPTLFGFPIGDGLKVEEGLPIFSAINWTPPAPPIPPLPTTWPPSPFGVGGVVPGAGGYLQGWSPTNMFRLFITPTLTGGVGTAACFGGPPSIVGYASGIPGLSPLFPGGNCIVMAKSMFGCSDDGSDGDVGSTGNVIYNGDFGYINGNCKSEEDKQFLNTDYANKYYKYLNGSISDSEVGTFKGAISDHSGPNVGPLFTLNGGNGEEISISFDAASGDFDFGDVTKVIQKRISAFPNFLMDWATRQIQEIISKLTDFPTLYVILPDFSGIFDGNWAENSGNDDSFDLLSTAGELGGIDESKIENETLKGAAGKVNSSIDSIKNSETTKRVNSGIKEAYEFISSTPLVKIEQEKVNMTIPWISIPEIDKSIASRNNTLAQWKSEAVRAGESWSLGKTCDYSDPNEQAKCEEENKAILNANLKVSGFIDTLEANIEVLEDYKKTPEKIYSYLNKKEEYLEQILCNVEIISEVLGGWIGKNGERFKAWVETYILVKAILKSWQLLIDVFVDYESECKECKNERGDLMSFIWKLISMIIPKIPVIQFPKWPDIILDLHNIRAGLTIELPEFEIDTKPILLPELPNLYLPDAPSVNLDIDLRLPEIPVLPTFEFPALPDLPSLPSVELPDLPPPPKLPKMFGELTAVLDILKLITKAMCILKSSPFVPEWRAGDQIAYLTERNGYMPFDFLNVSSPQFSFPFVDAIKVTTYVNLEFQSDFVVELARQVAMPINSFTADFTNIFNINAQDLDFRELVPSQLDVNINNDGVETSIDPLLDSRNKSALLFAGAVSNNITNLVDYIDKNKSVEVTNEEFKRKIFSDLASESITSNPRLDEIRGVWKNVENYTFSKEDKLIKELKDNNTEKFDVVKDILNTEIIKNKNKTKELKDFINGNKIIKVGFNNDSGVEEYNDSLKKYNDKFIEKTKALINPDKSIEKEIKKSGNDLLNKINTTVLNRYKNSINHLAANDAINSNTASANSCNTGGGNGDYKYTYEGIYIIENSTSYRLFSYLDELDGDEVTTSFDYDNDSDEDLLYFANNVLYLKENLKETKAKNYVSDSPLFLSSDDNKFFNGDEYYETVNNVSEQGVGNKFVNIRFDNHTSNKVDNYRLSFYDRVDKFRNENNDFYRPKFTKKNIYDGLANYDNSTLINSNELYISRKNKVFINNIGDTNGIELNTTELVDISTDILNNNIVTVAPGNRIYSGDKTSTIKYRKEDSSIGNIIIPKYTNIELNSTLEIIGVLGNSYISTGKEVKYVGEDIRKMFKKPLSFNSSIEYVGGTLEVQDDSYIELVYFDDSELSLDFEDIKKWYLYDLGSQSKSYIYSLDLENDFYYGKINIFKNNIKGTDSKQLLLSPQSAADETAPTLDIPSIRIPVYQKEIVDFTPYLYEDGGISGISEAYIDFDLEVDSDGDGKKNNDNDSKDLENIILNKTNSHLKFEFGKFEELMDKNIGITLIDLNGNVSYNEVNFEVYSPIPNIFSIDGENIDGTIDANLTDEPVNLYRYRGGVLTKLANQNGENTSLTDLGNYDFNIGNAGTGVVFEKTDESIGFIDEKTGKISVTNPGFTKEVLSSNDKNNDTVYPKILVLDNNNKLFYQSIKVTGLSRVNLINEFNENLEKGIYLNFINKTNYNFYSIPENVPYNPGSVSIYRIGDVNKEPLFTVFKDGRIYTLNTNYKLDYGSYDKYVVIKLIDKHFNREIARVLYSIDGEYIIK